MLDTRLKEHNCREGRCLVLVKRATCSGNYRSLDKWVRAPQDRRRMLHIDKTSRIASFLPALSAQGSKGLRQSSIATS